MTDNEPPDPDTNSESTPSIQEPTEASTSPPGPAVPPPPPGAVPLAVTYHYGYPVPKKETNGLAIASLVLGLSGFITLLFLIPWVTGIGAVICGHLALRKTGRSGGRVGGRGMAIAGLILGYIWVGGSLFLLVTSLAGY